MNSEQENTRKFKMGVAMLFGILIWVVLFTKIFVVDIELELLNKLGLSDHWIVIYRALVYMLFIGVAWKLMGHKRFFLNVLLIAFCPLIILFWYMPKYLFYAIPKKLLIKKNWLLFYVYINSWINHVFSLQHNIIKLPLFLLALVALANSKNTITLYVSIIILLVVLFIHLFNRFRLAFSPIRLFRLNLHLLKSRKNSPDSYTSKSLETFKEYQLENTGNEQQIEEKKWTVVDQMLTTHSVLKFLGNRLREFKSPRVYMGFTSLALLYSIILSILLLTLSNYGLWKASELQFSVSEDTGLFNYFYYTFNSFFFNSIPDITPIGMFAKCLNMLAPTVGVVLTLFILTVYFSAKSEEYKENIEEVIEFSELRVNEIELELKEAFSLTINEGFEAIKNAKVSISEIVNKLNVIE